MAHAASGDLAPNGQAAVRSLHEHGYPRPLAVATAGATAPGAGEAGIECCWMCGIHLPVGLLVADGAGACEDVRWYCRDTSACTERWTSRSMLPGAAHDSAATPERD